MSHELLMILSMSIPLIGAVFISSLSRLPDVRETVTLITAVLTFLVTVFLAGHTGDGALDGTAPSWTMLVIDGSLSLTFTLEPLGALFAMIAAGLWILNSIYSIGYMRGNNEQKQTRFYVFFALSISSAIGIALAGNLFTLFVFYELLTLATYPLVAHKGDAKAARGARIYMLTLLTTSIGFLLVAIVWTYTVTGSLDFVNGGIVSEHVSATVAGALLLLYAFGIGKAALMPFHFWLPNAMVAPTPVSALLHAVAVVKAGVFSMLKVGIYVFGLEGLRLATTTDFLLGLAVFTMIAASLIAMTKDNLKARLAFSTIAQLAYVTTGVMLATAAGFLGGALQILMHAFGKITLFMCAGAIYVATGKTEISQMRGFGRHMPIVFICFAIGSASIIGLPPFGGAWPKFQLMLGGIEADKMWVVWALLISSLLNIAYLLPIAITALMPPKTEETTSPFKTDKGTPAFAVLPLALTAFGTLTLFFFVEPVAQFLSPIWEAL